MPKVLYNAMIMTYEQNHLTVNTPFYSMDPLTDYLGSLEEVTVHPNAETIARVQETDKVLTDRSVLFADSEFVHDEGYRVFGYHSCTVSEGVVTHAELAQLDPSSPEFLEAYDRNFRVPTGIRVNFENGAPSVELFDKPVDPDKVRTDIGSPEMRRNAARVALIELGGSLAVSGAFIEREIEPAYKEIKATLERLGEDDSAADYSAFGLRRISRDLLNEYWWVQHRGAQHNPIGKREAFANIHHAWNVVGRPYGKFSRVVSALAGKPDF